MSAPRKSRAWEAIRSQALFLCCLRRSAAEDAGNGLEGDPLLPLEGRRKRVRVLEAELARKNEIIADLSVLVLRAKGMLKGKKRDKSE